MVSVIASMLSASAAVEFTLDGAGLATLQHNNQNFLRYFLGQTKGDLFVSVWKDGAANSQYENHSQTSLIAPDTVQQSYPWGQVTCTYTVDGDVLRFSIQVANQSQNTLSEVQLALADIQFPGQATPANWDNTNPPGTDNYKSPAILVGDYGSGTLALVNDDVNTRAWTQWSSRYYGAYPLRVSYWQPLPPGQTKAFTISLRWGESGASREQLAGDVFDAFQERYPQQLDWKDRRPIGSVFLASANREWADNPRGWFNDANLNISSPDGQNYFQTHLSWLADQIVGEMQDMNAQGCVVWDIEGEQYPQGLATFIGNPLLLPQMAPEMDPLADAFFARIKQAGFRVGVTIRCQHLVPFSQGGYVQEEYPNNDAIFDAMDQRIMYAQQRWGCTLFYFDSNGGVHGLYDVDIFRRLRAKHPDCLLIPEAQDDSYYSQTAPYEELRKLGANPGTDITPPGVRGLYPGAITVINTPEGDTVGRRGDLVAAVQRGDILMYRTWFRAPEFYDVKSIYQEGTANGGVVAYNDMFQVSAGNTQTLDVLANDFDLNPSDPPLNVVSWTQPDIGSVSVNNNQLQFSAPAGITGQTSFSYTISNGARSATATVKVGVFP